MYARWRFYTALILPACMVATSNTVQELNAEAGGWCTAILLLAMPLVWASLSSITPRHRAALSVLAIGIFILSGVVDLRSNWHVIVSVPDPQGPFTLSDGRGYLEPSLEPERIPLMSVNDAWAIRSADERICHITWWNDRERITKVAVLSSFFNKRSETLGSAWEPLLVLVIMVLGCFVVSMHAFIGNLHARGWRRFPISLAGFFGAGILLACCIRSPSSWLDNEFLSRPDDWLCYEAGARAMLSGNLLLMPPPGGVELWSVLYAPWVAAMHTMLGSATAPLYVVQFAVYLLLVPLVLRLFRDAAPAFRLIVGIGTWVFVSIDIDLHYAWHLLGDILPLLLLIALLISLNERRSAWSIGVLCGLLYWSRSELILIGPMVMVYQWWRRERTSNERSIVFVLWLVPVLCYLVRWYALHGTVRPFPVGMQETGHLPLAAMFTAEHMTLKLRALLGDYSALNPDLRTRYHWFIVHAFFLFALVRWIRTMNEHGIATLTFGLWAYALATRLLSPSIGIYGHRHALLLVLLEGLFVLFVLSKEHWSSLGTKARQVRLHSADLGPVQGFPK